MGQPVGHVRVSRLTSTLVGFKRVTTSVMSSALSESAKGEHKSELSVRGCDVCVGHRF